MVVCTRFEQEIGRKPGTGAGKWSSVPDLSRKSDGNRVQEKEKCHLYPCGAVWRRGRQVDSCVRWKWKQDCGIVIVVALTNDLHARQKATMEKG